MSGKVKQLNESERLEVISKLNQPNPPIVNKALHDRLKCEDIHKHSALMSKEAKKKTFKSFCG